MVKRFGLEVERVHTHIGSGSDPAVWTRVSRLSLSVCEHFPSVTTLNLGGGYKVARVAGEEATDIALAGAPVAAALQEFDRRWGRPLRLEIEPGTFLVANAGVVVSTVTDIVETGKEGFAFI